MKNRFKRFLSVTTAAVTGTLIACIFWYGIYCLTGQRQLWHSWIPYAVLPEILSIGVLAGGITELVLPQGREQPGGDDTADHSLCAGYGICTGVRIFLRLVHSEFFWRSGNVSDQCSGLFFHVCAELSGIQKDGK